MNRLSLTIVFFLTATCSAWAQDWQTRALCDMRRDISEDRACRCQSVASDVLMLLAEKAGPENVAVVAEFTNNLEKKQVSWEAPCRDPGHCPEAAYTIRYAFVSKKAAVVKRERTFAATVCDETTTGHNLADCACRKQLLGVMQELVTRARQQSLLLAVLDCTGLDEDQTASEPKATPIRLTYAFVDLPDMLPIAGDDPKKAAHRAVVDLYSVVPAPAPASAPRPQNAQRPEHTGSGNETVMQVAAMPNLVQAEMLADRLSAKGVEAFFEQAEVNGRAVYRVMARSSDDPALFSKHLTALGYPGSIERK